MPDEDPRTDPAWQRRTNRARSKTLFRLMDDVVRVLDKNSFDSIAQVMRAAAEAKAFEEEEGGAHGPLWGHAGSLWLRWAWLHHHGESLDEWNKSFEWYQVETLRRFKDDMGGDENHP